ncbi:MAG: tRNA (adenosine(37)-N6)-threonylcarbamoyltransferase complex ATPase subunit type 1 TsaE [Chitinophagaceae bacterium]|nr:tRNA (adenosine(37)-N6)-threonylcarbamoyltransferase complex ATPase subunit type 1 TsaE [Chitinophagaceae bacterium]
MDLNFSLNEISKAANQLLSLTDKNRVIAFHGEMGAGKTTIIHALCKVLGVKDAISSPTFSIINQYQTEKAATIYHIDLYRLKDEEEAIQTGVEDCLYSGSWCFVEWPEKAAAIFPETTLHVYITPLNNHTRKLTINL